MPQSSKGMEMLRFSANLGFLWGDVPLPEAVRRAGAAGFDAVELHWPYATPVGDLTAALAETGLPLLALNTRVFPGEFGLAAVPGAEVRAREGIMEAIAYIRAAGGTGVHVLSGKAEGAAAEAVFRENVAFAVKAAEGLTVLIEPINGRDMPGYFLQDYGLAAEIAAETGARVMLDTYHAMALGQDPLALWRAHGAVIGHVQFADFPGRGAPGTGEAGLDRLLPAIRDAGYAGPFGAEYRPAGPVEDGLGWLAAMKAQ
jgi:hydroxypyruvate isomerase